MPLFGVTLFGVTTVCQKSADVKVMTSKCWCRELLSYDELLIKNAHVNVLMSECLCDISYVKVTISSADV